MKRFCKNLKQQVTRIINYQEKRNDTINKRGKVHRRKTKWYICKKRFCIDDDNKMYHKVKDHCHYTRKHRRAAHDVCNLRYKTPKKFT